MGGVRDDQPATAAAPGKKQARAVSKRLSAFRGDYKLQASPPITENFILAHDSLDHEAEAQKAIQRIDSILADVGHSPFVSKLLRRVEQLPRPKAQKAAPAIIRKSEGIFNHHLLGVQWKELPPIILRDDAVLRWQDQPL